MRRHRITTGAELVEAAGPVSIAELASVLRCSEGYVRKLIKCGVLEVRHHQRFYRIPHGEAVRIAVELGAIE